MENSQITEERLMWDAPYCISLKSCFTHRGQGHVVSIWWGRMWLTTSGKEIQFGCEVGNSEGGFCQNQLCLQRLCFPALEKGDVITGAMKEISSAGGKRTENLSCEWRIFFLAENSDPRQETKTFWAWAIFDLANFVCVNNVKDVTHRK